MHARYVCDMSSVQVRFCIRAVIFARVCAYVCVFVCERDRASACETVWGCESVTFLPFHTCMFLYDFLFAGSPQPDCLFLKKKKKKQLMHLDAALHWPHQGTVYTRRVFFPKWHIQHLNTKSRPLLQKTHTRSEAFERSIKRSFSPRLAKRKGRKTHTWSSGKNF